MAAERLVQNPHLETLPNHTAPHYNEIRAVLVTTGITDEQAVHTLDTSWTRSHDERIQIWDQQVLDDAAAQEEERRLAQEQEDQQRAQRELELENEQREIEKKKPKMGVFNKNAMVSDFITPRPSAYALRRLADFDYAELWYFTQEGCADAMRQHTQNEDTFGLTKVDDMLSLKPVSSLKASKNVVQDIDLTWRQMEIAKTTLIQHITKHSWAEDAITALAQFYMNLEVHHYRQRAHGEHALIVYQARVRRNWHDQLKLGNGFNIAIINEMLLQSIHREIMDKKQAEALDEVSLPLPFKPYRHTQLIITSFFPHIKPSKLLQYTCYMLIPSPITTLHANTATSLFTYRYHHLLFATR